MLGYIAPQVVLGCRSCDDKAGCGRYEKSRYLADQSLADSGQGIFLDNGIDVESGSDHANDDSADNVYKRYDDSYNRIALDELACAVHGSIKGPPRAGFSAGALLPAGH